MAIRSVTRVTSTVVSVLSTVMKAMRDQVTLQRNVDKMVPGLGQPPVAVSWQSSQHAPNTKKYSNNNTTLFS